MTLFFQTEGLSDTEHVEHEADREQKAHEDLLKKRTVSGAEAYAVRSSPCLPKPVFLETRSAIIRVPRLILLKCD